MNISTEHISQCNQSEPQADASGKMVDLMNENESLIDLYQTIRIGHLNLRINATI